MARFTEWTVKVLSMFFVIVTVSTEVLGANPATDPRLLLPSTSQRFCSFEDVTLPGIACPKTPTNGLLLVTSVGSATEGTLAAPPLLKDPSTKTTPFTISNTGGAGEGLPSEVTTSCDTL